MFASSYLSPATPPPVYVFDQAFPTPFPLIDQGPNADCTIASAANIQMRFEELERRKYLAPRKGKTSGDYPDVLSLYDKVAQPGGGAYMLDALKVWRTDGLALASATKRAGVYVSPTVRAKATPYRIAGFAKVGAGKDAIIAALYAFKLLHVGLAVTRHMEETSVGQVDPVAGDEVLGGHAMAAVGFYAEPTPISVFGQTQTVCGLLVASTWNWLPLQVLGWDYVAQYCDEIYSVLDASDKAGQMVDRNAMLDDIKAVTS